MLIKLFYRYKESWLFLALVSIYEKLTPVHKITPGVYKDFPKVFVVRHPSPKGKQHFVIVPKTNLKSMDSIKGEQLGYIIDVFKTVDWLLDENDMRSHEHELRISTDDEKKHKKLYFHLIANE